MRRLAPLLVMMAAACVLASTAAASELVDRDAKLVSFKVDAQGLAGLVYDTPSKGRRTVLFWDAVDAIVPAIRGQKQVAFKKDYAGGYGTFRKNVVKDMKNACGRYDGPRLSLLVAACKAPDGSYWALQAWPRALPNLGLDPWKPEQKALELHLSHWTGELPVITASLNWAAAGRSRHLFGTFTYGGQPVFGFAATGAGVPLDTWGRNVYLDTFGSAYGAGWKRENSFLSHTGTGSFCYELTEHEPFPGYPAGRRPQGHGSRYRLTASGPGVTPIVTWEGRDPGEYDAASPAKARLESDMNAAQRALGDPLCALD